MVRYAIRDLHGLLLWIESFTNQTYAEERYRQIPEAARLNNQERSTVEQQIFCLRKHFVMLELHDAVAACDALKPESLTWMTLGECRGHLLGVRNLLISALSRRIFMYIPMRFAPYVGVAQEPVTRFPAAIFNKQPKALQPDPDANTVKPLGEDVFRVFKDARFDAEQFATCMVAGASTAAVFHLMRVVEWGVRALGADLGLKRIKEFPKPATGGVVVAKSKRKKPPPKFRLRPIENATWELIHNQLRVKIEKKILALRPGTARDAKSAFYNGLLEDFHGFKDAWRNHVMHTRDSFDEARAMLVLPHVSRFMGMLAGHLK